MAITWLLCGLIGLVSSSVYLGMTMIAAGRFARRRGGSGVVDDEEAPGVSVLKPVHGDEPNLSASLESFFRQRYDRFELVFGARSADDPALAVVDALRLRYPDITTRIVIAGPPVYPNAKVSTLAPMVEAAAHPYLLIADSDTCVTPECLREVTAPLGDPRVGLVTCLYRGVPIGSLSSRLEALGMSVELPSGVLVADMLEGTRFALGPTMATRKDVLDEIGGIAALGEYCADDFLLGRLVWQSGRGVILSSYVVDHVIVNRRWHASLQHQLRWMRTTRFSRPMGHVGTGLTFGMPFGVMAATAAMVAHHPGLGLGLLAWAYGSRVLQAVVVGFGALDDRESLSYCWLYPLRDLVGFVLWILSFTGRTIVWRGERYEMLPGGRLRNLSRAHVAPSISIPRAGDRTRALPRAASARVTE